jgi:hypothetical protein
MSDIYEKILRTKKVPMDEVVRRIERRSAELRRQNEAVQREVERKRRKLEEDMKKEYPY